MILKERKHTRANVCICEEKLNAAGVAIIAGRKTTASDIVKRAGLMPLIVGSLMSIGVNESVVCHPEFIEI